MKKIVALLLSALLALTGIVPAYAAKTYLENQSFSIEANKEWTNGITCLMVEDSDDYIPVIVHHQKDGLIVEVA